jgi:phenylacetate-CoA ligase
LPPLAWLSFGSFLEVLPPARSIDGRCWSEQLEMTSPIISIIEVERDDGSTSLEEGEGSELITRLRSEAMPMIRYRIGDRIRLVRNHCTCGVMNSPIIERILGRSWDFLRSPDGQLLSGNRFVAILEKIPGVVQFQISQVSSELISISLVTEANSSAVWSLANERLMREYSGFTYKIQSVDKIPWKPTANCGASSQR